MNTLRNALYLGWKGFLKWLKYTAIVSVYLIGLGGGAVWFNNDWFNGDVDAGMWFVWFYLFLTLLGWIYYKIQSKLPVGERGIKNVITKIRTDVKEKRDNIVHTSVTTFKVLLKIAKWLIIIGIVIAIATLFFSWIGGLSATTIIIILLVMILLK